MEQLGTFVFVVIPLLASVSGSALPRISGGTETRIGEFPYQVAIVKSKTLTLRCAGALVRDNYVLTSAFCAHLGTASETQVLVGNNNLTHETPSQLLDVEVIRAHEDYNIDGRINDLAILKLRSNVRIQETADAVSVRSTSTAEGTICTLTGWGSDIWNGQSFPVLRTLNLSIVNNEYCTTQLGQTIASAQICAVGSQENNACFLDEGDPLVCDGELTGVMSHSVNCGKQNKPSVYTDLAKYTAWIEKTISDLSSATAKSFCRLTILAMLVAILTFWNTRT
ncbi:trypsin alpha-3-like [Cryptotermes secundus]|uniref:trypsin alpha-3-like n=1 Tax=Cryptotermes secundus TaxID=105785 RepID=UPI000CD7AE76|nr:trypsin alpha-3-like [Cryptotermes secundus]